MHTADLSTADQHPEREGNLAFELADGTRLVPKAEATPACLQADRDHVFTLADVQRMGGEPFAGYRRERD
jgi:hypothetical protein